MAIQVRGTLTIKYRTGRNGKFPVGDLSCDIGEFSVKSKEFEQYSEGTYEGTFLISRIELASYMYRNSLNSYLSAKLDDFSIDNYQTGKVIEPEPVLPDPVDEETADEKPSVQVSNDTEVSSAQIDNESSIPNDPDLELFGAEIYEHVANLSKEVKLDPTVGRTILRSQADRMKQLGYTWEAQRQIWQKR